MTNKLGQSTFMTHTTSSGPTVMPPTKFAMPDPIWGQPVFQSSKHLVKPSNAWVYRDGWPQVAQARMSPDARDFIESLLRDMAAHGLSGGGAGPCNYVAVAGGALRDGLAGLPPKDVDVFISAYRKVPETLHRLLNFIKTRMMVPDRDVTVTCRPSRTHLVSTREGIKVREVGPPDALCEGMNGNLRAVVKVKYSPVTVEFVLKREPPGVGVTSPECGISDFDLRECMLATYLKHGTLMWVHEERALPGILKHQTLTYARTPSLRDVKRAESIQKRGASLGFSWNIAPYVQAPEIAYVE